MVTLRKVNVLCADGKVRTARVNSKYDLETPIMNGWLKEGHYSVAGFVVLVEEVAPYTTHLFEPKGKNKNVLPSWEEVLRYQSDLIMEGWENDEDA